MSADTFPSPGADPRIAIACTGIVKTYGGVQALKGIDLSIPSGTVEALVGQNGAGKSTMIGILTGRVAATEGTVLINGVQPTPGVPRASRAAGLVAIYQELTIVPGLSAEDNVYLGMTPSVAGVARGRDVRKGYLKLCERVGVKIPPRTLAGTLSIADQQILEIMRALVADASIILLDEPTAALSTSERDALIRLVRDLRTQGVTMIFVSHNLEEVLGVADHITVLRDGRVSRIGPVAEWTRDLLVTEMLGENTGPLHDELLDPEPPPAEHMAIADRPVPLRQQLPDRSPAPPLVATGINLPGLLYDIDISVQPGEIVGLGGLVGSGRTTLMRCLAGLEPRSQGTMRVDGDAVAWPRTARSALNAKIALIPEDRKGQGLVLGMTAMENIAMAALGKSANAGVLSTRKMRNLTAQMVEEFGFDPKRLQTKAGNLSGGNQQKLLLARWRYQMPKLLLADEPTRGVDVGAKAEILRALRRFADDGVGVIIASSELEEVSAVADRVLVLKDGRGVAELSRTDHPVHVHEILSAAFGETHDKENSGV
ncbi:sugar ABC transporter ATP-binding protein [Arthrobacter ramosus]|uniref:Sugar ABC transporter ATP-binding protein n=1 Tax=Arthrobacter ramosus TaxID=1672 RepID=A0ABV5XYB2_ARTRM|nr:sugar ABC transporter ATP-binding protein [Arthrobacter ramosus]